MCIEQFYTYRRCSLCLVWIWSGLPSNGVNSNPSPGLGFFEAMPAKEAALTGLLTGSMQCCLPIYFPDSSSLVYMLLPCAQRLMGKVV